MNVVDQLLTINKFSRPGSLRKGTHAAVVHWTNAPGQKSCNTGIFYEGRKLGKDGYGSAHRGLDFDGSVYRWIPDEELAYAVGSSDIDKESGKIYTDLARSLFGVYCNPNTSPNWLTLHCEWATLDYQGNFTDEQYAAGVELYATWMVQYQLDPMTDLLTHHDIIGMTGNSHETCHKFFTSNPDRWDQFKHDVQDAMSSVVSS